MWGGRQGNAEVRKQGIGVMMRKDGVIIRRGLGQPDWREAVAELSGAKQTGEFDDSYVPRFPVANKDSKKKKK